MKIFISIILAVFVVGCNAQVKDNEIVKTEAENNEKIIEVAI